MQLINIKGYFMKFRIIAFLCLVIAPHLVYAHTDATMVGTYDCSSNNGTQYSADFILNVSNQLNDTITFKNENSEVVAKYRKVKVVQNPDYSTKKNIHTVVNLASIFAFIVLPGSLAGTEAVSVFASARYAAEELAAERIAVTDGSKFKEVFNSFLSTKGTGLVTSNTDRVVLYSTAIGTGIILGEIEAQIMNNLFDHTPEVVTRACVQIQTGKAPEKFIQGGAFQLVESEDYQ
jgi:hypothetical protein